MANHYLKTRHKIVEAAIDLYLNNPQHLSVSKICQQTGINQYKFHLYFDSETDILEYVYLNMVQQYESMLAEIEDFQECSLEEKLSNFVYVMFELLEKRRAFVQASFEEIIIQHPSTHKFHKEIECLFYEFTETDQEWKNSSSSQKRTSEKCHYDSLNDITLQWISHQSVLSGYFELIKFWLKDDSDYFEKTASYADKLVSFWANLLHISASMRNSSGEAVFL